MCIVKSFLPSGGLFVLLLVQLGFTPALRSQPGKKAVVPVGDAKEKPFDGGLLARFRFNGNAKNEGQGEAKFELQNTQFKDNALFLNGKYEFGGDKDGYRAVCSTPKIDYTTFTVALRLKAKGFNLGTNLLTGGTNYRWFGMHRSNAGNLVVTLNNQAFAHEIKGATLDEGKWLVVACGVDIPKRKIIACLNGKKVAHIDLPKEFELEIVKAQLGGDKVWSFTNYSNGNVFHGLVDELLIYDRTLNVEELEKLPLPEQPGKNGIVAAGAKLEKLFDGGLVLTEGVAVAPDGMVYFSDITFSFAAKDKKGPIEAGHIWKFDPKTGKTTIFRSPSGMSNGIKFDAGGNMIVAEGADFGGRRVIKTDMKTGKSYIIAGLYEGRPFNSPNDITIDEKGRIYFSDPRYVGHEPIDQPVQAVYRIDPDGGIHRIITDAGKPNGVCVSPDQKTLYVVSNDNGTTAIGRLPKEAPVHKGRMALLAYDLAADGTAKFRKVLVDYAPQDGPDGMVCDAEGNLYVAVRAETRPGIGVYSPTGEELAFIKTELPTNVGFGRGAESRTLYITAGKSLYRIRVNKEGYQLPGK